MIARSRPTSVEYKAGSSEASRVVTEIDRASEAIMLEALQPTLDHFHLAVLTEEQPDDGGRLSADHFWCIDPLDGTLPFVEGRAGYAVSIALVARDGTPLIGVVHDPVSGEHLVAVAGGGVERNGQLWQPALHVAPVDGPLSVFADRSFFTSEHAQRVGDVLEHVAIEVGARGVRYESSRGAVMNARGVLDAPPALYLKVPTASGGGSLWDFAATACLFNEAGASVSDVFGEPLELNRPDSTFMHHRGVLFASSQELADHVRLRLV